VLVNSKETKKFVTYDITLIEFKVDGQNVSVSKELQTENEYFG